MNERIQKLAEHAGLQLGIVLENSTTPVKTITIEQRKFAELIVGECIKILADNSEFRSCVIIGKHFKVEE